MSDHNLPTFILKKFACIYSNIYFNTKLNEVRNPLLFSRKKLLLLSDLWFSLHNPISSVKTSWYSLNGIKKKWHVYHWWWFNENNRIMQVLDWKEANERKKYSWKNKRRRATILLLHKFDFYSQEMTHS